MCLVKSRVLNYKKQKQITKGNNQVLYEKHKQIKQNIWKINWHRLMMN